MGGPLLAGGPLLDGRPLLAVPNVPTFGTARRGLPPSTILAVPNVTAHPSKASVPITVLLCGGPLLCGFNVAIKGLRNERLRDARMIMPGHCDVTTQTGLDGQCVQQLIDFFMTVHWTLTATRAVVWPHVA